METVANKKEIMRQRWNALEKSMDANGLDVVMIYGKGIITQYGYLNYFCDYYPILRPGFVVYAKGQQPIVYYSTRADCYLAKQTGSIADSRFVGTGDVIQSEDPLFSEVVRQINEYKPHKVGVVGLESFMTYEQYDYFKREIQAETIDATGMVAKIKAIKSAQEQAGIRQAFALAEKSFLAFKDAIRPGLTGAEIAGEVERIARGNGAIDTLVFIEEGPYFLRKPTLTPLSNKGLITAYVELIDANGYWVEKGGLFALGELPAEALKLGETCVAAMEEVKRTIRPGISVGDIAKAIHKHTDDLDVKMGIWHGHGIGVDHDLPIISDNGTDLLEEGMVISVHPNFADADEKYGASIADVFIVTKDGAESLSKLPYDIVRL